MKSSKKLVRVVAVVAAGCVAVGLSASLGGCNTVSGVGKDIQEASDNVKNAIEN
jgi:predicted small secreted protein